MDSDEDTGEVENRGQNGFQGNLAVRQLHIVGHQESGSTHDRGHDLTAGGGRCFRGGGKFGLVAGLLHQGNGNGAGANGIGNGGTGDHTFHGGSHHGHLGGAAGEAAHKGVGDVDEEVGNAGALQEGTEDDEHNDELGADIDGGGEDTFLGIEKVADRVVQPAPQGGIRQTPDQSVDDETGGHNQNGQAHAAAADLGQGQDAHDADDNLIGFKTAALLDDVHGENIEIQES